MVTGASSGIGAATARRLARASFTVYGAARRTDRLAELATDGVRALSLDVTSDDSMTAAVDEVLAESGRIDVLVNNAGAAARYRRSRTCRWTSPPPGRVQPLRTGG